MSKSEIQGGLIDWLPWPKWKKPEQKVKRVALSKKTRFRILARDGFTCQYCGRKAPDVELHVDHRVAVVRGGTDNEANLVAACVECNAGKSSGLLLTSSAIRTSQMTDLHRSTLATLQDAADGAFRRYLLGRGEHRSDLLVFECDADGTKWRQDRDEDEAWPS